MDERYSRFTPRQVSGSEYGGVDETRNTVQPKGADALTPGEQLRLGYLTGDLTDTRQETLASIEDKRQFLGLKPAGDERPNWLVNTGRITEAEIQGIPHPDGMLDDDFGIPGGY